MGTRDDDVVPPTAPLLCCGEEGSAILSSAVRKTSAKLANSNKRFYNNLALAFAMACWITIFALPCCSNYISWVVFGRKDVCGDNKMGFKTNLGTDHHPVLVNMNATLALDGYEVFAWCGFLPGSYLRSWPAIVQTMLFTVFLSTGSTIKLAWQGLAGTFLAVLNVLLLSILYPQGAADENYRKIVVWADLIVVLFLFLATKADTNTMMYGMNWTVALMLHFMNPNTGPTLGTYESAIPYVNWDGETTVTLLTAAAGSALAIVATILPKPMLNIRNVHSDSEEIIKGVDQIFTEAIEYWAADAPTMKRFSVYAKMSQLTKAVTRVTANLEDSYWETFDLGSFGRIRHLYSMFFEAIAGTSDEVFLLKAAIASLNFDGKGTFHKEIVEKVKESLDRLKNNAVDCLWICGKSCKDGSISRAERYEIEAARAEIEKAQQDLANQFLLATQRDDYCSEHTASESLFVFAIANWAQETSDFAGDLAKHEENYLKQNSKYSFLNFGRQVCSNFASTFDPKAALDPDQLRYVFINLMPIIITYAMSMAIDGHIFVQYSPVMPSLLTLLMSTAHRTPFIKNAQRLTGVVFGHTMPLLVMCVVHMLDCDDRFRIVLHMSSIFVFFFCFCFMYYASDQWSSVGCLIAGFGVYPLLVPCQDDFHAHYGAQFKDIVQVIIAIMLKILFSNCFAKSEPRDIALAQVIDINKSIVRAYTCFFDGDIHGPRGLTAMRADLKIKLQTLEDFACLADPSLAIVPGSRTPFKYKLLCQALTQYRLILSDIDMLMLAMAGHQRHHVEDPDATRTKTDLDDEEELATRKLQQEIVLHKLMKSQTAWLGVRADMIRTMDVTLALLEAILEHDSEEPLNAKAMEDIRTMTNLSSLENLPDFYKQISASHATLSDDAIFKDKRIIIELRRTRLTVAMNSLALSVQHATSLAAACFDQMASI